MRFVRYEILCIKSKRSQLHLLAPQSVSYSYDVTSAFGDDSVMTMLVFLPRSLYDLCRLTCLANSLYPNPLLVGRIHVLALATRVVQSFYSNLQQRHTHHGLRHGGVNDIYLSVRFSGLIRISTSQAAFMSQDFHTV